jgi:hypothetical protein
MNKSLKQKTDKINVPGLFLDADLSSCEKWIKSVESKLKDSGYSRYEQNFKREDFAYWKTFRFNDKKAYQVGVFFYDFRKYADSFGNEYLGNRIDIQFYCMLLDDGRIDLEVNKDITLAEFETMAGEFYKAMEKFR